MARQVLFDRFMSAKYLEKSSHVQWNCEHVLQDDMHLFIRRDRTDFERIFRYKLADKQGEYVSVEDLEISLEVGLEYTGTQIHKDPILFTVASDDWAIGIQLRDLTEYTTLGPYIGYEGKPGRVLSQHSPTLDKELATNPHWPRYFRMTFKPLEKVAVCRTPIDDGHLLTVVYDKHNPIVDVTKSDLYLDVYRFNDFENYIINYIKATVTIQTC